MPGMNPTNLTMAKRAPTLPVQSAPTAGMTPMAPANQQPSTQRGTPMTMTGGRTDIPRLRTPPPPMAVTAGRADIPRVPTPMKGRI